MLKEFIVQNYLIIENNVVTNIVVWDGNTATWTPPAGSIALVQAITPALVWQLNTATPPVYVLTQVIGAGSVGFTWDGESVVTNLPQPTVPPVTP